MSKRNMPRQNRVRVAAKLTVGLLAGVAALATLSADPAEAWHRRHHYFRHFAHRHHHIRIVHHFRHNRPVGVDGSKFAAIVIDGSTGRELYGRNENALRHPASITKVMTLYLLFEELQKGRMHLDTRIPISAHAASMAPTKLGLRPGSTIDIDDAIKAIVTQSANDIAVAIAEAIGGSEDRFCEMMTAKAHSLGMTRTHYADASGLPNDEQITTAHDLAILGRDIQARFPQYYHYFSIRHFAYRGVPYHNHNHLLGKVEGVDGIKTGYTRASGFNLMTSVKRDGHYIIAVVMGGTTYASRDRMMANLIEDHIDDGAPGHRTMVAEKPAPEDEQAAGDDKDTGNEMDEDSADATPQNAAPREANAPAAAEPPARPTALASAVEREQQQEGSTAPMPVGRPRPAVVSAAPKPTSLPTEAAQAEAEPPKRPAFDGTTGRSTIATATPSSLHWVVGPQPVRMGEPDVKQPAKIAMRAVDEPRAEKAEKIEARTDKIEARVEKIEARAPESTGSVPETVDRPAVARSGWMIQIGATDDADKAHALLARAKSEGPRSLSRATPFTEKFQKGSETFYRARFAGLEAETAEAACKSLKRSGFACFATKN